jgi:hypothetical protein
MAYLTDYNLIYNLIPNSNNNSAPSSSINLRDPAKEAGDTVLTVAAMKAAVEIGQTVQQLKVKLAFL